MSNFTEIFTTCGKPIFVRLLIGMQERKKQRNKETNKQRNKERNKQTNK
jgi:hypothetical protein